MTRVFWSRRFIEFWIGGPNPVYQGRWIYRITNFIVQNVALCYPESCLNDNIFKSNWIPILVFSCIRKILTIVSFLLCLQKKHKETRFISWRNRLGKQAPSRRMWRGSARRNDGTAWGFRGIVGGGVNSSGGDWIRRDERFRCDRRKGRDGVILKDSASTYSPGYKFANIGSGGLYSPKKWANSCKDR